MRTARGRVAQQVGGRFTFGRRQALVGIQGRHAHQRTWVLQRGFGGHHRVLAGRARQARQRRGARNCGLLRIRHQLRQFHRRRPSAVAGRERLGKVLEARLGLRVALAHFRGRPLRRAIAVTLVAGVRYTEARREIRPRNAEAVIVPRVDHHVRHGAHVTVGAGRSGFSGRVEMMAGRIVFRSEMALCTYRVARCARLRAVRLVAIAAGHALRVHAAREERTPVVHLVALLAVRMIQTGRQQRRRVVIRERLPGVIAIRELSAPRMALRAHVDLVVGRAGHAAHRVAALRVDRPRHAAAIAEFGGEAAARQALAALGRRVCECDVLGAGPVAGFAPDTDLRPFRRVGVGRRVVVLPHVGRVAVGAHVIPVLLPLRPVQLVARIDPLVRVEVEPALSSLAGRPRIPGDGECLHVRRPAIRPGTAAAGTRRRRVAPRTRPGLPSGPSVRIRYLPSRRKKRVVTPKLRKLASLKSPSTVLSFGDLHGHRVLRALPEPERVLVTARAGARTDVGRWLTRSGRRYSRSRRRRRCWLLTGGRPALEPDTAEHDEEEGGRDNQQRAAGTTAGGRRRSHCRDVRNSRFGRVILQFARRN